MAKKADYSPSIDPLRDRCPVRATLDVIRGRWKPSILLELKDGPKRYSDFRDAASLAGITPQALTTQLRQLEADGVVSRKIFAEIPLRTEYKLTAAGASLSGVMDQLEAWGTNNLASARRKK